MTGGIQSPIWTPLLSLVSLLGGDDISFALKQSLQCKIQGKSVTGKPAGMQAPTPPPPMLL